MTLSLSDMDPLRGLAKILWQYNNISQAPRSADLLLVMGTNDLRVALFASSLLTVFEFGHIVVSGGVSHSLALHGQAFGGSEATVLARVMVETGADMARITLEDQATNTGENIRFTRMLLARSNITIKTGQLVHTPTMQRRALATAEAQWPEVAWTVSGEEMDYDRYVRDLDGRKYINSVVGDTAKVLAYPARGFQTPQAMPGEVKDTLIKLIRLGFTDSLPDNFDEGLLAV